MKMSRLLLVCLMAGITSSLSAQEPATAPDGRHVLTLEEAMSGYSVLPLQYPGVQWSRNDKHDEAAFRLDFINRQRVWRYATRGDYQLVSNTSDERRMLGQGLPEKSLMFAKISPDGSRVAYVSGNNIWMENCDLADKNVTALTTDGSDLIVNGTFDWVYEEEFDCRDGFRWSSDSHYIAFWQSDTEGTGWFDIINNVDSIYPTVSHFPYPKAGTANSAVRIGVLDTSNPGSAPRWLDLPGDARENYLPRMEFIPGTNRLMIQQMNRAQNTNTVWTAEVGEGELKANVLCVDSDEAWVETNDNIHWLSGNKAFIFTSERDGWRHLWRVSADGQKWTCITPGDFDVIHEVAYDEGRGYIYFMSALPDKATERLMMRASVNGKSKVENITAMCHPSDMQAGQYSYRLSPDYSEAIETFSSANHVPTYNLVSMDKKGRWSFFKVLEENAEAQQAWENLAVGPKEFVKCKSGDLELDAWIIKPFDFDPTKKYPVIDMVYGEPASATVQNTFETYLFWHYLANQGYIVVSVENRGAAAPRGREWRKCIYGEVGVAADEDQARGVMDLCRQFEWMDSTRIGITGWSGGGSQTLGCMFRYPEVFKTGIAIAFVADQRLYDTIYQERYMNTPQNNPDGYFRGSPINFVDGLQGNLLLIHGTGDDNVHYQNCEMLTNRLIAAGKRFWQVSYPMRTHGISEGRGTSLHLRETMVEFFGRFL